MRLSQASRAALSPAGIHPALARFAEECHGLFGRLLAYMGGLALVAIVAVSMWDQLQLEDARPATQAGWNAASHAYPAFALSRSDLFGKTESYEILLHPEGGRKDVFRWGGGNPVAELEIYRPGHELRRSGPPIAEVAARIDPGGTHELQAAGLIDSKFGAIALLGLIERGIEPACLGFIKQVEQANLHISGWSCQGDTLAARRVSIGCMLNRLVLLAAGNDAKLADLFARAELQRTPCLPAAPTRPADWVTGAQNPQLRGGL